MATRVAAGVGGAALSIEPQAPVPVAFDEMRGTGGEIRTAYAELAGWLEGISAETLVQRRPKTCYESQHLLPPRSLNGLPRITYLYY